MPCNAADCDRPSLKTCSRCGEARYCSKECQAKHWKIHKRVCKIKPRIVAQYKDSILLGGTFDQRSRPEDYESFRHFVNTRRVPLFAVCYLFREQLEAFAEKKERCYLVVNEGPQAPFTGVYAYKDKIHPRIVAHPRHADFRKYVHRVCHGETLVFVWFMRPRGLFASIIAVPWGSPRDRIRTVLKNFQVTDEDEIAAWCTELGV